jgi:TRAP-type C4-dicarboxylate transport system permease small subunit
VFESIGVVAVLLMMAVTCIDVIGAKVLQRPVPGSIDIVMLAQLVAISFVIGITQILGRHVKVDFIMTGLSDRAQAVIDGIIQLFIMALFVILVWGFFTFGTFLRTGGEVSPTADIPLFPFLYSAAVASVLVCLVVLIQFANSIIGVLRK